MGIRSKLKTFLRSLFHRPRHRLDYPASDSFLEKGKGLQDAERDKEIVAEYPRQRMIATKRSDPNSQQVQKLKIYLEKSEGKGEDAEPILEVQENKGVLAVFDGLGGSGSTSYTAANGKNYSGAYFASRLAQRVMIERWQEYDVDTETVIPFLDDLEANLQVRFQKYAAKLIPTTSETLKGTTLKRFPTTIASVIYTRLHAADIATLENPPGLKPGAYQLACTWAGDSRCYLLHPTDGLQQITKDDTVFETDAYSSLYNDPPIAKTINAEERIALNRELIYLTSPSIVFVCSDGCYNYLETPMHFEQIMLASLLSASTMGEWKGHLGAALGRVAGDDVSLALAVIGWKDFTSLKKSFESRYKYVENTYMEPLQTIQNTIRELDERIVAAKKEQDTLKHYLWTQYKQGYARYSD